MRCYRTMIVAPVLLPSRPGWFDFDDIRAGFSQQQSGKWPRISLCRIDYTQTAQR